MAYRYGNRHQMSLLPPSIEEYVGKDDPVRAYDAFVEALDFGQLGIEIDSGKVGNSQYDPKAMLKLLIYGYSYGVKSSRKLERQTHHNVSFIWLMGGLTPDHKTIAEFRRKNRNAIQKVLKQCARMCIKLNLVSGNVLFVDGTKIRANASAAQTHDKAWYEQQLECVDQRISQFLQDCEAVDEKETGLASFVAMDKELSEAKDLKRKIKGILAQFEEDPSRKRINLTDPDCANMSSVQGKHASYNVQSVVDDERGIIVHTEAVNDSSDINQFARQIDQAQDVIQKPCETACADAGYADTDELEKIDAQGIKVIVPSKRQASRKDADPFCKQAFSYDREQDCYFCPEGHMLKLAQTHRKTGNKYYQIVTKQLCHRCRHWGSCTTGKSGRRIVRLHNEEATEKIENQYIQPESQKVYARRKDRVEHPFGHMKKNLQTSSFLLRGREGVQAETALLATCFNMARMTTILGVTGLIQSLSSAVA